MEMQSCDDHRSGLCVLLSQGHVTAIRIVVHDSREFCNLLQGSDSIDSWRTNLSFDPVPFEDTSLGVSVHRGIYGAAHALYSRFAPMVAEHLATSPFARISLTGHSLGGSIATVLALMMVHRGLIRPSQLGPIYTFGAAACFCEADHADRVAGITRRSTSEGGVVRSHSASSLTLTLAHMTTQQGLRRVFLFGETHFLEVSEHRCACMIPRSDTEKVNLHAWQDLIQCRRDIEVNVDAGGDCGDAREVLW
jgi:hypothetical protein